MPNDIDAKVAFVNRVLALQAALRIATERRESIIAELSTMRMDAPSPPPDTWGTQPRTAQELAMRMDEPSPRGDLDGFDYFAPQNRMDSTASSKTIHRNDADESIEFRYESDGIQEAAEPTVGNGGTPRTMAGWRSKPISRTGISPAIVEHLRKAGVLACGQLADLYPSRISEVKQIGSKTAVKILDTLDEDCRLWCQEDLKAAMALALATNSN